MPTNADKPDEQVFRLGTKPLPLEVDGVKFTIRRHGDRKRLRIVVAAEKPMRAKRKAT